MSNLFNKFFKSVKNNGIKFTFSLLKFLLFGGQDPRLTPEYMEHYSKLTEPQRFADNLTSYIKNPYQLSEENIYDSHRTILPIDCMIDFTYQKKRLNLVFEQFTDEILLSSQSGAAALATSLAVANGMDLRIISRNCPANASAYYRTIASLGISCPEHVSFYTDIERDNQGSCQFKLPISDGDCFMASSWTTAVALGKTVLHPNFLYYLSPEDYQLNTPGNELYWSTLPKGILYIIETAEQWTYLCNHHPQLISSAICLQNANKEDLLKKMYKHINRS